MAWSPSPQDSITVWRSNPTARSWLGDTTSTAQSTVPGGLNGVVAIAAGDLSQSGAQIRRHGRGLGRQLLRPEHGAGRIEWRGRHRRRRRSQSGAQIRRHGRGLGTNDFGQKHGAGRIEWRGRHRRRMLSQSGAQIRRHGRGLGRPTTSAKARCRAD